MRFTAGALFHNPVVRISIVSQREAVAFRHIKDVYAILYYDPAYTIIQRQINSISGITPKMQTQTQKTTKL